jgi:hypothetical protein
MGMFHPLNSFFARNLWTVFESKIRFFVTTMRTKNSKDSKYALNMFSLVSVFLCIYAILGLIKMKGNPRPMLPPVVRLIKLFADVIIDVFLIG